MSTLTTAPEVTRYLEEVRRHLADLSAEERDGLMEDLEDHLAEVAAEHGLPLERRLGEPGAFAAELRASAGLDGGPGPADRRRWGQARSLAGSLAGSPTGQQVRAFMPELRPGWWVLRGYLAVAVLAVIGDGRDGMRTFPFPGLGGNAFLGLMAIALAIPASVALGRRAFETGHRRGLDRTATVLVGLGCLIGITAVQSGSQAVWYPVEPHYSGTGERGSSLHDAEGRPITNVFAYDSDGRLLDGVYLYDQAGRPLDDVSQVTEDGQPVETKYRLDANGAPVTNAYPLDVRVSVAPDWSRNGQPGFRPIEPETEPLRPPAVVVPPPATTTAPTTPATTAG